MTLKGLIATGLLAGAAFVSVPAVAQDAGFYVGGGVGRSNWDTDTTGLAGSSDDTDTGWKVFAGYQFNKYFAVEGGYVDLGKASFSGVLAAPIPPFAAGTSAAADIDGKAWFLVLVGSLPLSNQFSVFGKVGVSRTDVDVTARLGGLSGSIGEDSTETTYGLGVRFDFTRNFALRAEWDRFRAGSGALGGRSDIDLYTINAIFKF